MSTYDGYNPNDNARRKANNVGDELPELGHNKNVKAISTKPGQMSGAMQSLREANFYKNRSRKNPVTLVQDPKILAELNERYGCTPTNTPEVNEMDGTEERIRIAGEIADLLMIWFSLGNTWPIAKTALEIKINALGEKLEVS